MKLFVVAFDDAQDHINFNKRDVTVAGENLFERVFDFKIARVQTCGNEVGDCL